MNSLQWTARCNASTAEGDESCMAFEVNSCLEAKSGRLLFHLPANGMIIVCSISSRSYTQCIVCYVCLKYPTPALVFVYL